MSELVLRACLTTAGVTCLVCLVSKVTLMLNSSSLLPHAGMMCLLCSPAAYLISWLLNLMELQTGPWFRNFFNSLKKKNPAYLVMHQGASRKP